MEDKDIVQAIYASVGGDAPEGASCTRVKIDWGDGSPSSDDQSSPAPAWGWTTIAANAAMVVIGGLLLWVALIVTP